MATIGRAAAVAQLGNRQFSGYVAWLLWLLVHLLQINHFQNRLMVFVQWAWSYFTYSRSSRIITGNEHIELVFQPSTRNESRKPDDPGLPNG